MRRDHHWVTSAERLFEQIPEHYFSGRRRHKGFRFIQQKRNGLSLFSIGEYPHEEMRAELTKAHASKIVLLPGVLDDKYGNNFFAYDRLKGTISNRHYIPFYLFVVTSNEVADLGG